MKRDRIVNVVLLLLLALILFTPLGFHLKVWINRIVVFSPDRVEPYEEIVLDSYNWNLKDRQGNNFNFEQVRGEVVLVNFWASWCPPCVAEMPDLDKLYNDYEDKVVFLFIARDKVEKVDAFLEKNNYELPVYYELSPTPEVLDNNSLPTTYILDKKGAIVVAETGAASWNSKKTRSLLDDLLKN